MANFDFIDKANSKGKQIYTKHCYNDEGEFKKSTVRTNSQNDLNIDDTNYNMKHYRGPYNYDDGDYEGVRYKGVGFGSIIIVTKKSKVTNNYDNYDDYYDDDDLWNTNSIMDKFIEQNKKGETK